MIVGFDSAEFHGVKAVTKGRRCTLAMWYTLDKRFEEQTRIQVTKILDKIPNEVDAHEHSQYMTTESKNNNEKVKMQEQEGHKTKEKNIHYQEKSDIKEASVQTKLYNKHSKEFKQMVNDKNDKELPNHKELTTTQENKLRKDDEEDDGVTIEVVENDDIHEPETAYEKRQNLDTKQNSHTEL